MEDLFEHKAGDWDAMPIPAQISAGVGRAIREQVDLRADMRVMDFGAGTGLICGHVAPKPELQGKVETVCQDIMERPLGAKVDLVVSAMAMHHVRDTGRLLKSFAAHLNPGGRVALADLDAEDGSFHPPDTQGVYHRGFEREALRELLERHGFAQIEFSTALEVEREGRHYPIFFVTATLA
jgi:2-polyprenyl-3-methyl-5-hydroxy-6-metoxy-1,4-benzoquinol methylase